MQELRGEAGRSEAPPFTIPLRAPPPKPLPRRDRLARFFDAEILPRLLDAHPPTPPMPQTPAAVIEDVVGGLLAPEFPQARAAFETAAACCGTESRFLLEVLAPAARRLGVLWEEDSLDFFDVTRALTRLQAKLAELKLRRAPARRAGPTLLMLTAPDETHSFGADLAAELFRREGWTVERGDSSRLPRLAERRFTALGVSCGSERTLAELPAFLERARALALSPPPAFLVGGAAFAAAPAQTSQFAVDFVAVETDAPRRITRALVERRHL